MDISLDAKALEAARKAVGTIPAAIVWKLVTAYLQALPPQFPLGAAGEPLGRLLSTVHQLTAYHITKPETPDHEPVMVLNGILRELDDRFTAYALAAAPIDRPVADRAGLAIVDELIRKHLDITRGAYDPGEVRGAVLSTLESLHGDIRAAFGEARNG